MAGKSPMVAGQRYNRLVAIEFVKKDEIGSQHWWKFKCDCGKEHITRVNSVRMGRTKSCGCYNQECKIERQKKPDGYSSSKKAFRTYQSNARARGLNFELSFEEFKKLGESNCWICGIEPKQIIKAENGRTTPWIYNGIDRLDNNKGYTIDNCKACCGTCNYSKSDLTIDEFFNWIKRVKENNEDKF